MKPFVIALVVLTISYLPTAAQSNDFTVCMREDIDSERDPTTIKACDRSISGTRDPLQRAALLKRRAKLKGSWGEDKYGAISDLTAALALTPNEPELLIERGTHHKYAGLFLKAKTDYEAVLRVSPRNTSAFWYLSLLHFEQREYRDALDAISNAVNLSSESQYRAQRGIILLSLGRVDEALADAQAILQREDTYPRALFVRASAFDQRRMPSEAITDYQLALTENKRQRRGKLFDKDEKVAKERIEALSKSLATAGEIPRFLLPSHPTKHAKGDVSQSNPTASRLAVIIGNADYAGYTRLNNPANDTRSVAAAFRRLGFAEVVEKTDLDKASLEAALKDFGDMAADADWAVVYYSGHGIQVDGQSYIVPTNAKLARASHVEDEAVPLDRVLSKVRDAKKLRLVILDACRDNPFLPKMQQTAGTRSVSRGLARIEPSSGVLVAYSARDGQLAQDGTGQNSPFTEALLEHLEEPGLEIGLLFRKVRDSVLRKTKNAQEPFVYGSIPSEEMYFKPKAN